MWLVNLVPVIVAACLVVPTCHGAVVSEEALDPAVKERIDRQTSLTAYYVTSWQRIIDNKDMEIVANEATAIGELALTHGDPVTIVVHGRQSSVKSEFGHIMRSSLIADKESTVIFLDWSLIASLNYDQAVLLVPTIAEDLIYFITQMVTAQKLDRDQLHLIGFDLGAHIVGIASRRADARARKITALSPAAERWPVDSQRLRTTDAQFVETINTDVSGSAAYGIAYGEDSDDVSFGTLHFFPNGGTSQPGCETEDNWCSHNRAWQLFAASVATSGELAGPRCVSMAQVTSNACVGASAVMGTLETIKLQTGVHRVNTGSVWPYNP